MFCDMTVGIAANFGTHKQMDEQNDGQIDMDVKIVTFIVTK